MGRHRHRGGVLAAGSAADSPNSLAWYPLPPNLGPAAPCDPKSDAAGYPVIPLPGYRECLGIPGTQFGFTNLGWGGINADVRNAFIRSARKFPSCAAGHRGLSSIRV